MSNDKRAIEIIKRREFMKLCGVGTMTGILAACQPQGNGSGTIIANPTKMATPTDADWAALVHNLKGQLIRPDSVEYPTALQLFDERFDTVKPAGIAYCISPEDVQTCLAFAHKSSLPFSVRAGGHSYAGYSTTTGLIIDVTRMPTVKLDAGNGNATIGAGARLIDVYAALADHGRVLPAGSCPTVGIAGLTLGGGIGVLGRKFGLTCDSLQAAQVVLADGRIVNCDANHEPDLFWALRGGGGGNFGVVTSFTFQTYPVDTLSTFTLTWPWSKAGDVVDAWQNWAPHTVDEIWSNCLLLATSDKKVGPVVRANGVCVGAVASLNGPLQQLINQVGTAPSNRTVSSYNIFDTMLIEAGCYGKTVAQCHLPSQDPNGQVQRDIAIAKSDYFTKTLPRAGIDNLVNAIASRQANADLGAGGFGLDAYGGAINRIAPDATAFVHRDALFCAQYSANWNASDASSVIAANHSWLNAAWQPMRPYASGSAYQNYIDPDLSDWQQAYYGQNLARLQRVKANYDPNNLFHFAQSIAPHR